MIFYFSGTGNSRWAAQRLADSFGEQMVSMANARNTSKSYTLQKDERLGFVFPVYSWGPPPLVLDFIRALCLSESPGYIYFVCTCGDDIGKTTQVMQNVCSRKGWNLHAGYSLTMPNTYVCLSGFDVDEPEVAQRKLKEAEGRIRTIAARLAKQASEFDCHEGTMPWIKTYLIRPLFNRFAISPRKFRALPTCVHCGKCAKVCPVQNISLIEGHPEWGKHCTMCLACYHHCPKHAVAYGKETQRKGQYIHPASSSYK